MLLFASLQFFGKHSNFVLLPLNLMLRRFGALPQCVELRSKLVVLPPHKLALQPLDLLIERLNLTDNSGNNRFTIRR